MKVKFINNNFYIYSKDLNAVLKIKQTNGLIVTLEIVDSLPIDGDELDSNDMLVLSVLDNLNQLSIQLTNEALK